MAIGLLFNTPECTREMYHALQAQLHPDKKTSPGCLYHAAGPTPEGWRVFEVWESREAAEDYFKTTLGAALAKANIQARPDVFHIHSTMQP